MTAGQEEDVFDVRGDVALVTGAASGLGLAFAEALAERGAHVTLADVDADVLAASTQALADRGLHVRAEVVDVTDADAVQAAVDRVVETEGSLDVVFANAGIGAVPGYAFEGGQTLDAIKSADLNRVLDVNLHGMLNTIGSAAGVMKPSGPGGSSSRPRSRASSRSRSSATATSPARPRSSTSSGTRRWSWRPTGSP